MLLGGAGTGQRSLSDGSGLQQEDAVMPAMNAVDEFESGANKFEDI